MKVLQRSLIKDNRKPSTKELKGAKNHLSASQRKGY